MRPSCLEVVQGLEAVDGGFGLGESREREGGDGESFFRVVSEELF